MTLAGQIAAKARESGAIAEKSKYFSVTDKKKVHAGNGTMVDVEVPNGQHRVKILSQKIGTGKNFKGVEQEMLIMTTTDNGVENLWDMPIKHEEGKLYYLIEDLEEIEIGEEFFVEAFKLQNGKYGKQIKKSLEQIRGAGMASRSFNSMSQLVKKIVQDWEAERIFRSTIYRSKRDPSIEYVTTIYWGGTMSSPNITCTCPMSTFQRKMCHHAEAMWNELDSFAKQPVIHHDEIAAKPWYRKGARE